MCEIEQVIHIKYIKPGFLHKYILKLFHFQLHFYLHFFVKWPLLINLHYCATVVVCKHVKTIILHKLLF